MKFFEPAHLSKKNVALMVIVFALFAALLLYVCDLQAQIETLRAAVNTTREPIVEIAGKVGHFL